MKYELPFWGGLIIANVGTMLNNMLMSVIWIAYSIIVFSLGIYQEYREIKFKENLINRMEKIRK